MSDQLGKVVRLSFKDKNALYQSYMSFVKNGGLYIPSQGYMPPMGKPVFLIADLPESSDVYYASGKVCWVYDGRRKGFGIMLANDERTKALRVAIENALALTLKSQSPTLTM